MTAWRAVFDHIEVQTLPGGLRSLKITESGNVVYDRVLAANEAAHLARLLTS